MCAALDARLGTDDVCALGATREPSTSSSSLIVSGLPSDGYGRGAVAPILPNEPTLFFRAGIENICENVADEVVETRWSSADPDAAIRDFVEIVMALAPSDVRHGPAIDVLKDHFTSALEEDGISPTDALRSTFVAACLAPSAVSMGL